MTDDQHVRGRCLCGAVQFEIDLPTKFCAHCHCSMCRRAHGAPLVTWAGVRAEQFRLVSGADQLCRHRSSPGCTRSFCGNCGSMLLFEGARWPGEVHVAVANLDGDIDKQPAAHVYYGHRAPWFEAKDDLPKLGGDSGVEPMAPDPG